MAFVSRQLGHAKPTTTLAVYAHLYAQAEHAHTARAALETSHQALTETHDTQPRIGSATETTMETEPGLPPSEPRTQPHAPERQN